MRSMKLISAAAGLISATLACSCALAQAQGAGGRAQATAGSQHAGGQGKRHLGQLMAQLTDEQINQLKELRAQLQAGDISRDEFKKNVNEIIGDMPLPPMGGPGGRGGAMRHGGPGGFSRGGEMPIGRIAARLGLSDDQKTQAQGIFKAAREDVKTQRRAAVQSVRALLTSDQQVIVDHFLSGHMRPAQTEAAAEATNVGTSRVATGPRFGRGPIGGPGHHSGAPGVAGGVAPLLPPPLIAKLNLTDDQKASLKSVREGYQASAKARLEQAKSDFRSILTAEQASKLNELKDRQQRPGRMGRATPGRS